MIDGKAGTIMACCQGNCCGFVLLRFFLYFVLSFQGQKMRGKKIILTQDSLRDSVSLVNELCVTA